MEIRELLQEILTKKQGDGGIQTVVWIAAGGSNGGFYPAQYFMDRESKTIRSQSFTSNEFVYATPKFVGKNTLAVICSMRGTPETCKAAAVAKALGATTIGLYVQESELTTICEHKIQYESIALDESRSDHVNSSIGLQIAMTLLHLVEDYDGYDEAMLGFTIVDRIYRKAKDDIEASAQAWAQQNKEERCIYVMGCGPTYGAAYIFSICNIMEMLQIDSPTVNCCEFFHGPFETLNKDTSVFLLMGEGRTRPADERAKAFLEQHGGEHVYVLDAKQLGIEKIDQKVREYFNHILFAPILNNVFMRQLSYATGKDYNTRTYMWQMPY